MSGAQSQFHLRGLATWRAVAVAVAVVSMMGWAILTVSPFLLFLAIAILIITVALLSHSLKNLEATAFQHLRVASGDKPAVQSPTVDDGARALVEGAAFQSIATSYVRPTSISY